MHKTGVRSVHAYARGRRCETATQDVKSMPDAVRIRYNPHVRGEFYDAATGEPVTRMSLFAVEGKTAWGVP